MSEAVNLIVVGCGPHYRARYHGVLESLQASRQVRIVLAVDLEAKRENTLAFFRDRKLKPERIHFFPERLRSPGDDPATLSALQAAMPELAGAHGMIVSTEPKAHKAYALLAMRNGLHLFMDKPLTAFNGRYEPGFFRRDHDELMRAQRSGGVRAVVSCERRMQAGYEVVFDHLAGVIAEYGVPITGVDLHFSGGKWLTPDEYMEDESHPYKYGYGILLHSGYHFVDLLARLFALNGPLLGDYACRRLFAFARHPASAAGWLSKCASIRGGGSEARGAVDALASLGETEVMVMGELGHGGLPGPVFSLSLTDLSVSGRKNLSALTDTYLGGGRLRQERLTIHIGPLCSIHVSSDAMAPQIPGTPENFSVTIYRNTGVIDGESIRCIDRASLSQSGAIGQAEILNTKARQDQLSSFLNGGDGNSTLESHGDTARLLDSIFSEMTRAGSGESNAVDGEPAMLARTCYA